MTYIKTSCHAEDAGVYNHNPESLKSSHKKNTFVCFPQKINIPNPILSSHLWNYVTVPKRNAGQHRMHL